MSESQKKSRRDFLKKASAGAAALTAGSTLITGTNQAQNKPKQMFAKGRIIGANDRINIGFVGCGGRMGTHLNHIMLRAEEKGDVRAVAVNDIYERHKKRAQDITKVDDKAVYHDYRELCARPDIDVVVIASPDHWHHAHAMEALRNGKDVYLEKPMTYTVEEAKDIAEAVKKSKRVLQVGSQYTSMDHFHKAKQAIKDGLIGQVMWASGGFGRNSNKRGFEWNYKIQDDASEKTIDWKAFLGSAPKVPFDAARYFRWRKYWDYSGGIATDLFYHTLSPLLLAIGPDFPNRVAGTGGLYFQKDREVPDTFFLNADYPSFTLQLACSVGSGVGAPLVIHGSEGTIFVAQDSENLNNTTIKIVPDREYKDSFKQKTGQDELSIEVHPHQRGTHPHMDNFLDSVRSRQDPNLPADLGYKAMAAIRMSVDSYRKGDMMFFDRQNEKVSPRQLAKV